MTKAYDYFLSYAGEDTEDARRLRSMLAKTGSVFFAGDIEKGSDWESELRHAIADSQNVVVLLSEASTGATYQRAEIDFALRAAERDQSVHVTPICVGINHDDLPLGLNTKQAIAISSWAELDDIVDQLKLKRSGPHASSGTSVRIGELVIELERLLVEKHNAPRTVAWLADGDAGGSVSGRNARIAELSSKILGEFHAQAGSFVAGATLVTVIGRGSFADVWEGEGRGGGHVAVKVFHVALLEKDLMLWRFRRGAAALARLGERKRRKQAGAEPGSIMELLELDESQLAYSMPLMSCGTLEGIATFKWSLDRKLLAFDRLCSAVEYAHGQNIIHRDVKPGNVMINDSYEPVLSDFDIADVGLVTQFSTAIGGLGTPVFAAPEQLRSAEEATERSDVFSLGRLLHFMLIERSPGPYAGEPDLANLRSFHPSLVDIVRRCSQRDPTSRFANVSEVRGALRSHQKLSVRLRVEALGVVRYARSHVIVLSAVAAVAATTAGVGLIGAQALRASAQRREQLESLLDRYMELEKSQAEIHRKEKTAIAATLDIRERISAKEREIDETENSRAYAQTAGERNYKLTKISDARRELGTLRSELDQRNADIEAQRREAERFLQDQQQERLRIQQLHQKKPSSETLTFWAQRRCTMRFSSTLPQSQE